MLEGWLSDITGDCVHTCHVHTESVVTRAGEFLPCNCTSGPRKGFRARVCRVITFNFYFFLPTGRHHCKCWDEEDSKFVVYDDPLAGDDDPVQQAAGKSS